MWTEIGCLTFRDREIKREKLSPYPVARHILGFVLQFDDFSRQNSFLQILCTAHVYFPACMARRKLWRHRFRCFTGVLGCRACFQSWLFEICANEAIIFVALFIINPSRSLLSNLVRELSFRFRNAVIRFVILLLELCIIIQGEHYFLTVRNWMAEPIEVGGIFVCEHFCESGVFFCDVVRSLRELVLLRQCNPFKVLNHIKRNCAICSFNLILFSAVSSLKQTLVVSKP